ncbi:MAG: hypothetical protein AAGD13_17460 [Pseudomonadota bacterium]
MRVIKVVATVAVVALGGCTGLTTSNMPSQTIDASFSGTAVNRDRTSALYMAYKVFPVAGYVAVCGAWAKKYGALAPEVFLGDSAIYLGEERILGSLKFFSRAQLEPPHGMSGQAACTKTDVRWRPEFATMRPRHTLTPSKYREPAWARRKREEAEAARAAAKQRAQSSTPTTE